MSDLNQTIADIKIPDGPASKYGKIAIALFALLTAIITTFDINVDLEQLAPLIPAAAILYKYMDGKYIQSAAVLTNVPGPVQEDDASGEDDLADAEVEQALEELPPVDFEAETPAPDSEQPVTPPGLER